jgi:fructose/tagatose bisphosphate aldolase
MIFENQNQLQSKAQKILKVKGDTVEIADPAELRGTLIDDLIYTAVFSEDPQTQAYARWLIRRTGAALGILSSSIHDLYMAMGKAQAAGFTVPAINLRGLTYHSARAVFRAALKGNVGPFIFEIARSEIGYTEQRPAEYTAAVTAAAIKTGYTGPIFLQGDHFQVSVKKYAADPATEVGAVRDLIREAVQAGFYNIDIDSSTVVDLSKPTIEDQQHANFSVAAELTAMIRGIEPKGITVSVGGEIGEVGKQNSNPEELRGFMTGYLRELQRQGKGLQGISKISVQTGTTHGGVPLPDGTIASVKLDFETLEKLSHIARTEYGMAGAVQHGASTLPDEAFDKFPKTGTAEVHLATGFQNMIYDSGAFPSDLRKSIYDYVHQNLADERGSKDSDEQFIYKTRKKALGPFKKDMWHLSAGILEKIGGELENKFSFLFGKLNVQNTKDVIPKFIKPVDVPLSVPSTEAKAVKKQENYEGGE